MVKSISIKKETKNTMSVLLVIAESVEELEAVSIADVVARAGIAVTIATIGEKKETKCSRGVTLVADCLLKECQNKKYDVICLPGGLPGANYLAKDTLLISMLKQQLIENRYIAAICASPALVFEANGILEGRRATCYPSFQPKLHNQSAVSQRVVVDNHVITSQAPGSAIEFALAIVKELKGEQKMKETEAPLVLNFTY
ncbi:protein DJ-1, putative [Entamoeba invadens IP1]|uniref:Protein DJ-1, putative n=1 Tax=Entamoeba invadens IP1 TaxID=370355 RepID=A0A0A1U0P6_ENTIV|nr:protein DJ-1, putative [Entamoeba invadens IP1]ELP87475.1 protein DJ-1, putative [Entamoeba invadens IP1]|eukprot:XP_004254246.1 protein DJ-1, putative [Entamoeba invadens IP1]